MRLLTGLFVAALLHGQTAEDAFRAIRSGDSAALRAMADVNLRDRVDLTPLHYAALYGNPESVRILLEKGADVKARNKSDATPLIYAAYNFEKASLLVEKGSDVNAHSSSGMTPLLIAASVHGNVATLRLLLDKGADIKATDNGGGADALQTAASKGDSDMVRLLLDKGADPKRMDKGGYTALLNSFSTPDPVRVQMLIAAGSDVNAANTFSGAVKNGPIALVHMTPLFVGAADADTKTINALLAAGAHPDEADQRKLTPLMAAICTDQPNLATIHALIAAHADVNAKDQNGESVLDWAMKHRNPEILAILKDAGAKPAKPFMPPARPSDYQPTAKDAVARSTALLAKSGQAFFSEGGGCIGCHHQPMDARVFAALKASNSHPDAHLRQVFLDAIVARRPRLLSGLPLQTAGGGDYDELMAIVQAMAELGEPASPLTDVFLHYLAARQEPNGSWSLPGGERPPIEMSNLSRTSIAIRAFKAYGWPARQAEFDERIVRARKWLTDAKPLMSYEAADRITGLKAAGVPDRDLEKSVRELIALQRPDGGWAQTQFLDSDSYATGTVLSTLYQTGFLKPSDQAYARGVAFLLKTQFPDGSWYVRSRVPKLQPYFQSAFPFDHDQWISATGTALAVMALAPVAQ